MTTVVVHGVEIPERLIAEEAQHHPAPTAAASRSAAAHALATKALLLRRAAELGLEPVPERDEAGREETEEAALVRAVLEAEIEIARPTDAECRRVYEAQRSAIQRQARGQIPAFEVLAEQIRLRLESRAWTAAATRYVVALAEQTRGKGVVATLDEGGVRGGSLCLGDMIGDREATRRLLQWLETADSHLLFLLLEEAADRCAEPAPLVRELVAEFVARADDELWTTVVSAARNGDDPAYSALAAVLRATLPKAGGRLCRGEARCAH